MPCSAAMNSIMWKPKYFHTMTIRIASIEVCGLASRCGASAPNSAVDRGEQAVIAVIDEAEDQAGRDLGQHVGQEEQHAQRDRAAEFLRQHQRERQRERQLDQQRDQDDQDVVAEREAERARSRTRSGNCRGRSSWSGRPPFPLKWLPAEIRRDQPVAAEAFMHVMFRENGAAEIPEHRKAALMGQKIAADVMAVRREDSRNGWRCREAVPRKTG